MVLQAVSLVEVLTDFHLYQVERVYHSYLLKLQDHYNLGYYHHVFRLVFLVLHYI